MFAHKVSSPRFGSRSWPAGSRSVYPRLLFVGEGVSLAHVSRPLALARWAHAAGYEVHFACGESYAPLARGEGFEPIHVTTIVPSIFYKRLKRGKFFYTAAELEGYVQAERELFTRVRPDLVVGDFRLSLDISTSLARLPLLSLNNAHWSPAAACRFPAPRHGLFGQLPSGIRESFFALLRPAAFRLFAAPLNRVRRRFGLPPLSDFRDLYTAGTWCAYLDLPDFAPLAAPLPAGHFFLGPVAWAPRNTFTTEITEPTESCLGFEIKEKKSGSVLHDLCVLPGEIGRSRPLAYVSLGSSGEQQVLPEVLRALVTQDCDVVLSGLGAAEAARLRLAVPDWDEHVATVELLDPREVLARAALCICHGGSGTVYQALSAGVPLLCLPGNPDQVLVSQALAASGAGVALAPELARGRRLAAALETVRKQPACRIAAQRLAAALARHDTRGRWVRFLAQAVGRPPHELLKARAGQAAFEVAVGASE